MALLHVQVGVAVGDAGRVTAVHVWVQIGDARTGDAHAVVHADVHTWGYAVGEAGARHQIAVVSLEVIALTRFIFSLFPGVLIAGSCLGTNLAKGALPLGVGCQDVLGVLILHTVVGVQGLALVGGYVVVLGVRLVGAGYVLGSVVEGLRRAELLGEVGLQGVLCGSGVALGEQVVELDSSNARCLLIIISVIVYIRWR